MFNRFGTGTVDYVKKTPSGEVDKEDVERYITGLITDFSHAKPAARNDTGAADEEKKQTEKENRQPKKEKAISSDDKDFYSDLEELASRVKYFEDKLREMRRLQDELKKVEKEREELSARLGEIEEKNIQSEEELKNLLTEKREIEERNQTLQSANDEALEKIRILSQEKEEAVLGENEAIEKYLQQLRENDDLSAELSNLRSVNERLSDEMDREFREAQYAGAEAAGDDSEDPYGYEKASDDGNFDEKYGTELATDSGRELFMMLRGLLQDDARDDNGVRMTKSWEEEIEETIPGAYPDETPITRKVRTRSEVSVEYIAGHKNDL